MPLRPSFVAPLAVLLATVLPALPAGAYTQSAPAADDLSTLAQRTGYQQTGRYDEVIALCEAFQQRHPKAVRCFDFGTTPQGRAMKAMAVSTAGALDPQAARGAGLPVMLVQGGIHAGEIDGKDAGFALIRELLDGRKSNPLDHAVLLFVPVFNVDGHERFAAWSRPNQRGPREMGWRTTAQNYNLNRDYVKADTPEMQAMLRLVGQWDPLAMMDLHVTDGAKFEHDVSIMVEPLDGGDAGLRKVGLAWREGVLERLRKLGSLPLPFYPSFVENDNPASGFEHGVAQPRFSQSYFAMRNRLGMLVETHSWKDYPTRVRITRNTVLAALELVAGNGPAWRREVQAADARAAALGGQPVALSWKATPKARTIAFRGYAYTRTPSDVSGALMTRYDESRPQVWNIPLRDEIVDNLVVTAPRAGYVVPAAHAPWVGAKLQQHGIGFRRVDFATPVVAAQEFRADKVEFAARSFEGRQTATVTGAWSALPLDIEAGALFVPIDQPLARLVMTLLEPQAEDSLVAWGSFNTAFERKEYMEDYVAEEVARELLKDPAVRARFEQRLRDDAAFAKDPALRLEFFARLHPSWDRAYNRYPVLRVDEAP
ncbi:M14 family metallopeptidase [Agrilutibacter solisilvae]|uniref:Peptidase M14 n=1 Tax=Agrilutibacter solisilvae TaxID=2763317 RepID=A0A974XYI6_9GAMM|nr:M14 family metallopeptidase [Lysobacter solisilvae]QSX78146.1 peptidase M14 [Lysobacter solisilvae]